LKEKTDMKFTLAQPAHPMPGKPLEIGIVRNIRRIARNGMADQWRKLDTQSLSPAGAVLAIGFMAHGDPRSGSISQSRRAVSVHLGGAF
jgi:hypothetical protein